MTPVSLGPVVHLVASLAWACVAVYAIASLRAFGADWLDAQRGPVPEEADAPLELPADIEALAQQESALWAQDDVRKAARERYDALRTSALSDADRWNLVRKALGIGTF